MITVNVLLMICGFICFLLAAFNLPTSGRPNLIALGLAFWILAKMLVSIVVR